MPYDDDQSHSEARRRRVFSAAAAAGCLAVVLSWVIRDPSDAFITSVYPTFAVYLAVLAIVMLLRDVPLHTAEILALVPVTAVIMGRLAWLLYSPVPIDEQLLVLAGGHYWAVAVLILAGYVLLDRRGGIVFGLGVLAASVVMVVTGVGQEFVDGTASREALAFLTRVHVFLLLVLILSAGVGALRGQLQRALARAEAYEELARTDHLTGLRNRRAATEALEFEARARARYGRAVSVITIDVDRFKAINDHHGHQKGDEVLVAIAEALRGQTRAADVVARWGGEEFLVIAPETDAEAATALAERCRARLAASTPGGLDVTATFGVTELGDDEDADDLLRRADQLLYDAKHAGRDRVLSAPARL